MIDTSIILTAHSRPEMSEKCLRQLKLCIDQNMEVILLDDAYDASNLLKELCEELKYTYVHTGATKTKDQWRIPGFALNIGVRKSKGDYIVIGNSEIFVEHAVRHQIDEAKRGVVCVTNVKIEHEDTNFHMHDRPYLPFFMALPKKPFVGIGGYDEDFVGAWYDDDDIAYRLHKIMDFCILRKYTVTHLWHKCDSPVEEEIQRINFNLMKDRAGQIQRNIGRDWGQNIDYV